MKGIVYGSCKNTLYLLLGSIASRGVEIHRSCSANGFERDTHRSRACIQHSTFRFSRCFVVDLVLNPRNAHKLFARNACQTKRDVILRRTYRGGFVNVGEWILIAASVEANGSFA